MGCGFCLLLFLIGAGIGLPLLAKFKRAVIQAVEDIEAANEIEKQRLEKQYEMPEVEESETIDDKEQPDEVEQATKPTDSHRQPMTLGSPEMQRSKSRLPQSPALNTASLNAA